MLEARRGRETVSSAAAALAGCSWPREGWMRPRTMHERSLLRENAQSSQLLILPSSHPIAQKNSSDAALPDHSSLLADAHNHSSNLLNIQMQHRCYPSNPEIAEIFQNFYGRAPGAAVDQGRAL